MKQSKIAITGGLGSGKSLVAAIVRELGFPVYSCDEINRELWGERGYLDMLASAFPQCVVNGVLDKKRLTQLVFSDEDALQRLNQISHPRIMQALMQKMQGEAVSFAEVPLLLEGGYRPLFDHVIAVRREKGARIDAVMQRDGCTREQALARMACQFDPDLLESTDCIILQNDGSEEQLRGLVKRALHSLGLFEE